MIPYLCKNDGCIVRGWSALILNNFSLMRAVGILFRNSDLVCGTLDKSILGGGTKTSLFHALMRDFTPEIAANCMSRLAKLCARYPIYSNYMDDVLNPPRWLGDQGFSIGIPDVQPSTRLTKQKLELVQSGYDACDAHIRQYKEGKLEASPGATVEQTLEVGDALSPAVQRITNSML